VIRIKWHKTIRKLKTPNNFKNILIQFYKEIRIIYFLDANFPDSKNIRIGSSMCNNNIQLAMLMTAKLQKHLIKLYFDLNITHKSQHPCIRTTSHFNTSKV